MSTHAVPFLVRMRRALNRTETRFMLAGAWNTAFGYLAFLAFYALLKDTAGAATILSAAYAVSVVQAFAVQRYLVFAATGPLFRQFLRFLAANTAIFVANLVFLPLAVRASDLSPPLLQAGFVLVSTILGYLLHKHYSFAAR